MTINFNCTGTERKKLVTAISEITQVKQKYLGAPTFAYEVDCFTIDKNGTLTADGPVSRETNSSIINALNESGFIGEVAERSDADEPVAESEIGGLVISMPRDSFTDTALDNLRRLVEAKGTLIRKALGADALPIEEMDETLSFPWFAGEPTAEESKAYTHFVSALCEMARNQKRVISKEKETDNDKYAFRCFLLRLGFIGSEYKGERKILLRNLSGSSAFKGCQKPKEEVRMITKEALHALRGRFTVGTRVELVQMDDVQAPPIGTKGTVTGVDDIGSVMVAWDNGCGLSVAYGDDICKVVSDND